MSKTEIRILTVIFAAVLCLATVTFHVSQKTQTATGRFRVPARETEMIQGNPQQIEEKLHYQTVDLAEGFKIALCGRPQIGNDRELVLYLTSMKENDVWIRAVVYNEQKQQLGSTGVLYPGEWVENIPLDTPVENGQTVIIKIISYQPETYYSKGSADIKVNVQK